ncbi:hypothetical protein [Ancylobacter lacus]|uniref:hypothetical protein n=1 Tax=Ancylobacter lacus TaxID=2579970 RepID=UPI001BD00686|nr:hypothetical protein [Ancylobacter lacus]MBS7538870.1 hypothetical protein [Ancylobacter lacus]
MKMTPLALRGLAAALAVAAAGCGEDEPRPPAASPAAEAPAAPAPALEKVAPPPADGLARRTRLDSGEAASPARWLASRAAGRDLPESDPAVARWRDLLAEADARFDESGRMIANRAVQLEAMLREKGLAASTQALVHDLAALAPKGSRAGFGTLCQHYYNLRLQGLDHGGALAALAGTVPRARSILWPEPAEAPAAPAPATPAAPAARP